MSTRLQSVLLVAAMAVVLASAFLVGRSRRAAPRDALTSVPKDAWLVASIDVAALRASPAMQPALGSNAAGTIPGLGPLKDACGFDPVARIDRAVICAPEGGDRGDFGVAFTGALSKDELERCADRVILARSGKPHASTRGTFTLVADESEPTHVRFAYREGGPFLVGRGAWLDAMIDATEGKGDPGGTTGPHAELATALRSGATATPALMVTALLPSGIRERLKAELGAEVGHESDQTYAAVLAVQAAGLAVTAGETTTDLRAALRCETPAACEEVKHLLERKRLGLSGNLGLRLFGLGSLVDSFKVESSGTSLTASARAATADLGRATQRLLELRTPRRPLAIPIDGGAGRQPSP